MSNFTFSEINKILVKSKTKLKESFTRGEQFNMFKACGVNHYENTHSAIVAELLNPDGSHGQKDMFLKLFIDNVIPDFKDFKTQTAECFTEYTIPGGRRIDILLRDIEKRIIVVENKIYAADQFAQLKDYSEYASKQTGQYRVIYLTLDGKEASDESAFQVKYCKASYKDNIIPWLEECIKASVKIPTIRETLIQYQLHLKQLTNQDMEKKEKEELVSLMMHNVEEIEAIFRVQKDFQISVLNNVKEQLEDFCSVNNLELDFSPEKLLNSSTEKGFYFKRPEWKKYVIWVYSEHREPYDFYIGISTFNGKINEEDYAKKKKKLNCFEGQESQTWPWGWSYLKEPYRNWWLGNGCFTAMLNGDFSKYLEEYVLCILQELESSKIALH